MNFSARTPFTQRLFERQSMIVELQSRLREDDFLLQPTHRGVVAFIEAMNLEAFIAAPNRGLTGRPQRERHAIANAFLAKVVLKISHTRGLIDRLRVDRTLREICGFAPQRGLPSEATFSRAFAEFARSSLAETAHARFVTEAYAGHIVGHLSRDGTAIPARERPAPVTLKAPKVKKKRGRPKTGERREAAPPTLSRIERQRTQSLAQIKAELPTRCDRGSKSNAQGYKNSWNGYKLHLDTTDSGIPICALLTSASVHDSQTAVPLSMMSAARVTNLYDVMDAAYCSATLRAYSESLGHVPLIDHNPRGGEKNEFAPHEAERYKIRTSSERANARLKDEFGGNTIFVRGAAKVMSHLMFGVCALAVDQWLRLLQ
jgi:hypothetical protein